MEPIRLQLTNFLSYRNEEIDLDGITCAALTGENGAGKSSLLDAILWALFGQGSRGKDLDNYVTRGEGECRVEMQFRLNGSLYRVVRGRSRQRGKSTLEFFAQDGDGAGWRTLSAKALTETQALIEQTLRMDYRTFTASSLILQGQADSFTANLTDTERKEVLGSILGLDVWDTLLERVRTKKREVDMSLHTFDAQQTTLKAIVASGAGVDGKKTEITTQLTTAEQEATELNNAVTDIEVRLRQRPVLEQSLTEVAQAAQKAREEQSSSQTRKTQINQLIDQCESQINDCQVMLARKSEIETAALEEPVKAAAVAELDRKAEEHTKLIEKVANIERQKARLDADKAARIAGLEAELKAINRREQIEQQVRQCKTHLKAAQETLQLKDEVEQALVAQEKLMREVDEHARLEQEYRKLSQEAERLSMLSMQFEAKKKATIDQLEASINMYQAQLEVLDRVSCTGDQQNTCPLLANAWQASEKIKALNDELAAWQLKLNPHDADVKALNEQIKALGYNPEARKATEAGLLECQKTTQLKPQIDAAEQRVAELKSQINVLESDYAMLNVHEQILTEKLAGIRAEANPFDVPYQEALAEKAALAYDPTAHQQAKAALVECQKLSQLKPQLDATEQRVDDLNKRIDELQTELNGLTDREALLVQQLAELEAKEQSINAELAALAPLTNELTEKRQALDKARAQEAALRTELGRIEQELAAVARAEAELEQVETELQGLRQRLNVIETLDQACGKKAGVPALIVENAVPEIERLANDMLGRMAGGRLQVRLDTQAETKSGTIQEVLRITVLEAGVERPYQTYSGAERFLVDLALRVALSKFLSHRAGAEIQLFVLDEGIGCADASNRQAILDAILAVSDEFGKTLVVTHLDELKEAFPQRIEVVKDSTGSKVRVA